MSELIERFASLLLSEPKGQIVACNLLYCHDAKVVEPSEVESIVKTSLHQFDADPPASCTELLGLLEIEWHAHRFHGPEAEVSDELCRTGFHHILRYEHFFDALDPKVRSATGIVARNPFTEVGAKQQAVTLNRLSGQPAGMFSSGKKLGHTTLWLTPDDLRPLTADRARDLLGLIHHGAGIALMRVSVASTIIRGLRARRPTFAAAGTHRRFRQRPDSYTPTGFGRAVDLQRHRTLPVGETVDGAMEVVTEPQGLHSLEIAWICLGCTKAHGEDQRVEKLIGMSPRAKPNYDEIFVQRLLGDKTLHNVEQDLHNLCTVSQGASKSEPAESK